MTTKIILAGILALSGFAAVLAVQHRQKEALREEIRSQSARILALRLDNERLSSEIAETERANTLSREQMRELMRLRSEVGSLRGQGDEVAQLRTETEQLRTALNETRRRGTPPLNDQGFVTVDIYSGRPLETPEHPSLRPAYEMAKSGDLEELLQVLNNHPEFLNLPVGTAGSTMLHTAGYNQQPEVVAELLRRGAAVNALNYQQHTPLYDAVSRGTPETVLMLLRAGADYTIPNQRGVTPLQMAIARGREDVAALLQQWGAQE